MGNFETKYIAVRRVRPKPESLPEFGCTGIARMNGDDTAEIPRMIEQRQGQQPADAVPAHFGADVETPHPQCLG